MEKNISILKAANLMGKSKQFLRVGLQRGIFPFGYAIKSDNSSKWNYYINPFQFYEYIGRPELFSKEAKK